MVRESDSFSAKLHKSDDDAIKTDVPLQWGSDQNTVPAGPFLQYLGQREGLWLGSVLLVLPPAKLNIEQDPELQYSTGGPATRSRGRRLDEQDGWTFWRFELQIQMIGEEQAVDYSLDMHDPKIPSRTYTFYVPAVQQPFHWGFHSCNGLSASADLEEWGEPTLWKDVLARHQQQHLHCMVGGGDQIYNDGFWKTKPFQEWLETSGDKERYEHPFTLEMDRTLSSWVMNHYRQHFTHSLLKEAFAIIPQVGQKDDHDIFDGWGSYPVRLQECPVFQGCFAVLDRFFLLFQMHTTPGRAFTDNDMFGPARCYSFLRTMGPNQAIVVPDTRGERTRNMVMSQEHYNEMFDRCAQLPSSINHLCVVFTVPLVYPALPLSQTILSAVEEMPRLKGAMTKTGVGAGIIDKFHHVELLDDIEDHWDSSTHIKERDACIVRFQEHTKLTQQRVTFISGDVHCAQVGRLYTTPKMKHLQHDHRFMVQITSSAIWNNPPPDVLLKLLQRFNKAKKINRNTREKTVKLFKAVHPKSPKLLGSRNWCEVTELPVLTPGTAGLIPRNSGALQFSIRAEDREDKTAAVEIYTVPVPTYTPPKNNSDKRMTYRSKQWSSCFSGHHSQQPLDEF